MVFDYSNLKGEIKKKYTSYDALCCETGMNKFTFQERIRRGMPFKIDEVMKIMSALSLSVTSDIIVDLFFVVK